jgi:hypothetical protein
MELAVHRLRKTKLQRAEPSDCNEIERPQARRSEVNDLFEVALQWHIATGRG